MANVENTQFSWKQIQQGVEILKRLIDIKSLTWRW